MMAPVKRVDGRGASALDGRVRLDIPKSIWRTLMLAGSLAAPFFITPGAIILFFISTYITLLIGHSVGMHRMMIHRSFDAPLPLKRFLIFLGALVGMGGPSQIIRTHDMRDWAQRLPACHVYFSHKRPFAIDIFWQLFCKFEFERPPKITIEDDIAADPVMKFLDRYWQVIQIALAGLLFACGGISWVLWGCCLRVFVSIAGHWSVTYVCHNPGPAHWHVKGAGVQASNLPFAGWITHGECWHNNHHAFPESAQIGLEPGQTDPGWFVISWLERAGLATNVGRPRAQSLREDLKEI